MDLDQVRRQLEKEGGRQNGSIVDSLPLRFFESFIAQDINVHVVEPGRITCSMTVPSRLLNTGNVLHGGVTATIVDVLGSSVLQTLGVSYTGVSMEISVSYVDAAYAGEEIEIEGKSLRVGKAIAVVSVELRKKKTGKIIAQGRHTKYLTLSSKI